MLINFLHPNLNPSIECDAVSDDVYHFNNLISRKMEEIHLGFQAYSVCKPPLTLKFKLNYLVNLDSIKIWTQIGSLKTTKIQVFTKTNKVIKIGEVCLKDEVGVLFHKDNSATATATDFGSFKKEVFYKNSYYAMKNVTEVHICIKETLKCPPVIKKIEIYGTPGKGNTPEQLSEIYQIQNPPFLDSESDNYNEKSKDEDSISDNDKTQEEFTIPEEYLDQITYEIMTLPMVLPSGKLIDQSTIETHNRYEARLGRLPYDPFTGKPYTQNSQPILNCSLKSQIDEFKLRHSNEKEIRNTGRTVGRKRKHDQQEQQQLQQVQQQVTNKKLINTSSNNLLNFDGKRFKLSSYSSKQTDLDSLINDALQNMTRFSRPLTKKIDNHLCVECKIPSNLYKMMSCKHLICRRCLLAGENTKKCVSCKIPYSKNNVVKFHPK